MKYFVYHGYISADRYDASDSPCYNLEIFNDADDVIELRKEYTEDKIENGDYYENVIFKVFAGTEVELVPKQLVETWEIK